MQTRVHNAEGEEEGVLTEKLVSDLKGIVQQVERGAVDRAKATDKVIRENPYQSIALAFGLGVLAGFFLWRR